MNKIIMMMSSEWMNGQWWWTKGGMHSRGDDKSVDYNELKMREKLVKIVKLKKVSTTKVIK